MNPRMQHRQHHRVHVTRLRTTANGAIRHVERVMRPARVLSASLAVCAIALAACGSASKPSRSGSADTQALQYASCMHSNGITNYPDPTNNGQPQSLNGIDPSAPAVQRAYNACRKHAPNGEAGPPAPSAAGLRRALAFARCMRKHGFSNFPDPLTTYGPGFTLGQGEYFPSTGATEFQSQASAHAAYACGVQLPSLSPPPASSKAPS